VIGGAVNPGHVHLFIKYPPKYCVSYISKMIKVSLRRLVEELEGIRVALVREKTGRKMKMVLEEMDAGQAN